MKVECVPRIPAKSRLSWRIHKLRLDDGGLGWHATGSKAGRVAVIALPDLTNPDEEEAWINEIEARFEQHSFDPVDGEAADSGPGARVELAR